MPYMLVGNCVHKKGSDGEAGEKVKCHEDHASALAHLRALEINVDKSLYENEIIYISNNTIKSFNDETGEIGELSIMFGDKDKKDFHGNWFTKNTFLGHNNGNGAVAFINHRVPLFTKGQFDEETEKALKSITDMKMKNPVETTVDDVGVFSKLVLDLSDKYEKMVYELSKKGVFKWSSGTGPQGYKALPSGELEMFVVFEQSLTPIPAEMRMLEHRVMPLKAYTDFMENASFKKQLFDVNSFAKSYFSVDTIVNSIKGDYDGHPFRGNQYTSGEGKRERMGGNSRWEIGKKRAIEGEIGMSAKILRETQNGFTIAIYFHDEKIDTVNADKSEGSIDYAVSEAVNMFRSSSDTALWRG